MLIKDLGRHLGNLEKIVALEKEGLWLIEKLSISTNEDRHLSKRVPNDIVGNSIRLKKNRASDNEGKFHSFLICILNRFLQIGKKSYGR